MLTPVFSISQTSETLSLDIRAPYSDISSTEVSAVEDEFRFFSKPYFLRLHLPGRIVETGNEIDYDFDEKMFRVKVAKETPGEHFQGLEFISTLLTKKSAKKSTAPMIEVVDGGAEYDGRSDDDEDGDEWLWKQNLPTAGLDDDEKSNIDFQVPKYGFNNKASGLFSSKLAEERREITDMSDPDSMTQSQRRGWKLEHESSKFEKEHYLADWLDEEGEIRGLIDAEESNVNNPVWVERWRNFNASSFSDEEKFTLKNLPRKEILLTSKEERKVASLSILDVFLASCYDFRSTDGESTVESGWTINKLSATTSCFLDFENVFDVVVSFFRRSLIFPLHRSWKLTTRCCFDAVENLKNGGKVAVVKRLIDVYKTFIVGDPRYILNDLYITDMILWAQSSDLSEKKVQRLANGLEVAVRELTKSDVDLDLDEWERVGKLVMEEEKRDVEGDDSGEEDSGEEDFGEESSISEEDGSCPSTSSYESSELDSDDDDVDDISAVTEKLKLISC